MRIPDYPKLHFLIKISEQNGYDVCTCTPSYTQEFVDHKTGEVTHTGKMEPIDVKVVGHIVHGKRSGRIVFDDAFLQLYPELRYYRAYCWDQNIEFEQVEDELVEIIYKSELERQDSLLRQKQLQLFDFAKRDQIKGDEFAYASSNKMRHDLVDYKGENIDLLISTQIDALKRLKEIRKQIDNYDEIIAQALAPRLNLIKEAFNLKALLGEGVVSSLREQDVLEHGLELEQRFNLPVSLMQDIQRRILRCSYEIGVNSPFTQANKAKELLNTFEATGGTKKAFKVVIVGGFGGMGSFMRCLLERANYAVSVVEVEDYKYDVNNCQVNDIKLSRAAERLRQAQWCIVSVPIAVTLETIRTIAPFLQTDCILSDLTSIKEKPIKCMLEVHEGPVLGLHPMFGPDTRSMVKQVVVAVPARDRSNCEFILDQFKLFGAQVVICEAAEHDVAMRVIQALRHFTTVAYGNFLRNLCEQVSVLKEDKKHYVAVASEDEQNKMSELGALFDTNIKQKETKRKKKEEVQETFLEKLLELSSPIYHLELMMVGRLFAQDPHLYCDIISASSENLELIQSYVYSTQSCLDLLLNQDKDEFVQQFEKTKKFFGKSASDFLKESSDVLALVQDTYPVKD